NSGQPRLARQVAYQIKDWLAKGLGAYGVFIAPYISPEAATVCKEAGIGYLDLAGNCLLSFETVFVHREGKPNSRVQHRELRSLYSSKAERILRVLLTRPQQSWKTEALAEAAQVSFGQISNVKKLLADREWLAPNGAGIRLNNPSAVLDEWAAQYRFRRNQVVDYYALAEVAECEYQLAEACQRQGMRYALTAFSGAARLAPAVRYQRAVAYVDGDPDSLTDSLGWKRVTSGANVSLLVPYDEGVFFDSREMGGMQLVTPVQIYLDLQNYRSRGQEAAQAIRKVIDQSW
ncbi:MAG: type IV toxin-antitoxin system AbiEi family antitoxin, partial [Anaerolineales bacterium]|nr:type IV toxin-antitoxin system AbiEi family antitoxin [Anaerolineales bacterium]